MRSEIPPPAANIAVVAGTLSRPAETRTLGSGTSLVTLEVTIRRADQPAVSVPVSWFDAPAWAAALDVDDPVVVVGEVRRRFFRVGSSTQARTDIVADTVVRGTHRKRVLGALRAGNERLAALAEEAGAG